MTIYTTKKLFAVFTARIAFEDYQAETGEGL